MKCENCGDEFQVIKDGAGGKNRKICYKCMPFGLTKTERTAHRYNLNLQRNKEYKISLGCSKCGYKKCASALEWHHASDDKKGDPSNALKRSWIAYLIETEKCVLLCSNCHREEHEKIVVQ